MPTVYQTEWGEFLQRSAFLHWPPHRNLIFPHLLHLLETGCQTCWFLEQCLLIIQMDWLYWWSWISTVSNVILSRILIFLQTSVSYPDEHQTSKWSYSAAGFLEKYCLITHSANQPRMFILQLQNTDSGWKTSQPQCPSVTLSTSLWADIVV